MRAAKANETVVVTPYNVTYDGTAHTATFTITGVDGETGATVGAVDVSGTTHTDANPSGYSDSWSFSGAANYNNIASTTITDVINKAALTITANNDSKIYGTLETFSGTTFTETGLVIGDAVTGVTETSAGAAAAVGFYSIVPGAPTGMGLGNYAISYVNGALTVLPRHYRAGRADRLRERGPGHQRPQPRHPDTGDDQRPDGDTGNGSGSVSLTGSTANLNAALATLAYRGSYDCFGGDTLSLTVRSGGISENASVAITVVSIAQEDAALQTQEKTLE